MTIYLINPADRKRESRPVAKRRMPPRNKDGTFRKRRKAATKRKRRRNPGTMATTPRRAPRRAAPARAPARRRRSNPAKKLRIVDTMVTGVMDAGQTLIGKAGVRMASGYLPMLPKVGAAGLAAEAAVALGIGLLADMVMGKGAARMVLAGALAAPLETALVAANIPLLSDVLSPGTATAALGRYAGYSAYANADVGAYGAYPGLTPRADPIAHGTSYVGYGNTQHELC